MIPATPSPAAHLPLPSPDVPARVLHLLGKDHLGPEVIHSLAALDGVGPLLGQVATGVQPASCYERENAIYALGMLGADTAVPDLARVLWSSDPNSQLLAARALGRIGSPAALAELRRLYHGTAAADLTPPAPLPYEGRGGQAPPVPRIAESGGAWQTSTHGASDGHGGMPAGTRPLPSAVALELRDILARYSLSDNDLEIKKEEFAPPGANDAPPFGVRTWGCKLLSGRG